jgi:hypothetical protein
MENNSINKRLKRKHIRDSIFSIGLIGMVELFIGFMLTSPGKGGFHQPIIYATDPMNIMLIILFSTFIFSALIISIIEYYKYNKNKNKSKKQKLRIIKYES